MTGTEVMRKQFEQYVLNSPFSRTTPLGVMQINGEFHHYMEPDTDTMWIGFALGYRTHERLMEARRILIALLIERKKVL